MDSDVIIVMYSFALLKPDDLQVFSEEENFDYFIARKLFECDYSRIVTMFRGIYLHGVGNVFCCEQRKLCEAVTCEFAATHFETEWMRT